MVKHFEHDDKRRKAGIRYRCGLLAFCVAAVLVLVVGTGFFGQQGSKTNMTQETNSVTNLTEEVADLGHVEERSSEPLEVTSDTRYGNYEKGKVLIAVDDSTDLDKLDSTLDQMDFVQANDLHAQDRTAGYVKVDIDGDMPMDRAIAALDTEGVRAQPNYVYPSCR